MKDTKRDGDIAEAVILAELLKRGHSVLVPWGERHKYDLVLDKCGQFLRIQCKTGRVYKGAVTFNTYSVIRDANTQKFVKRYYTTSDIDFYGVYCPALRKCFMVPASAVTRNGSLRVIPSVMSKALGGKLAADYDLESWPSGKAPGC